jgi:hypothetical protein
MGETFRAQYFATIDNFLESVEAFLRELPTDLLQAAFRDQTRDCSYAVRAAENTLGEHYGVEYSLL